MTASREPAWMRWFHLLLAAAYLLTAALILYFRLGPVQGVLARLRADGAEIPSWMPLLFTLGSAAAVIYLLWQGFRVLRRGLGGAGGEPPRRPRG